ncbi:MAG: iron ABC transporter permease [Ruminiclostridium sp.]|nr:iron ABC transporter permease [Ruminiclostridium sp.]
MRFFRYGCKRINVLLPVYLAITMSPLLFLSIESAKSLISGSIGDLSGLVLSYRRLILLGESIVLALSVSLAGMVFGTMGGLFLWKYEKGVLKYLRWLVMLFILIPPYIHAQSWILAIDRLNPLVTAIGLPAMDFNGYIPSWLVQLMSFLPISTGLALAGLKTVDPDTVDASILDTSLGKAFIRIVLPQAASHIFAGGSLLFILSLSDYSIPSLFRVNVFSLDIFAEYSSSGDFTGPFLLSVPYLAVTFLLLSAIYPHLAKLEWNGSSGKRAGMSLVFRKDTPVIVSIVMFLGMGVLLVQIFVPIINLIIETGSLKTFMTVVAQSRNEIYNSLSVSFFAALICMPISIAAASGIASNGMGKLKWLFVSLPLVMPASLMGIGAAAAWNRPVLSALYGSAAIVVVVAAARFAPFSAVIMYSGIKSIEPALTDVTRIYGKSLLDSWVRARLPLMLPSLLASFFIVFALTAGELGATLIVSPPGKSTLTLKIYNYLHYGATDVVSSLCLFVTILLLLSGTLAAAALSFSSKLRNL